MGVEVRTRTRQTGAVPIEAMNMICKGQVNGVNRGNSVSQLKFIESIFGITA